VVDDEWRTLLDEALAAGRGENWLAWWHLGVLRQNAGETGAAHRACQRSLALAETPWSLRNLALLALEDEQLGEAADLYMAALRLRPDLLALAVECGRTLMEAGRAQAWLDLLLTLPPHVRSAGRVRLLEGQAALAMGDLARVEPLFIERVEVDDLREGELSLSELWFRYQELKLSANEGLPVDDTLRGRVRREFPVPEHLDFRMKTA